MKWGYNFEMGPFETWDAIGLKESVEKMEAEGLPVPENIKKLIQVYQRHQSRQGLNCAHVLNQLIHYSTTTNSTYATSFCFLSFNTL